ncbi:MAG TPA: hypothetical protein VHP33_27405 [Polyangiaceae bacterium]|nr:hypothetical protein [Polyangiaceae bacterium]
MARGAEPPPDVPDLYALKTPDSPAFVALGVAPTEIQRPTTPSALATSLASAFQSTGGGVTLPQGFAMEAAPYWLVSHPTLSFRDYANSGIESSWYRNATISFATSGQARPAAGDTTDATEMSTTVPGTSVAWGLRTTILHPKLDGGQVKCALAISTILATSADKFQEQAVPEATRRAEAAWLAEHGPAPSKPGDPPTEVAEPQPPQLAAAGADTAARLAAMELALAEYRLKLTQYQAYVAAKKAHDANVAAFAEYRKFVAKTRSELVNGVKAELLAAFEKEEAPKRDAAMAPCLKSINSRGDGWSIDVAGASVYAFPDTTFKSGDFKRAQAWATFAYSAGHLSVLGLGRFTREKNVTATETELKNSFDYGARLIYADSQWGVSFEFLQRTLKDSPRRVSGGFDYRLLDGTWATATFGKDMGVGSNGAVIALLGLQLNTGKQRLKENSGQ